MYRSTVAAPRADLIVTDSSPSRERKNAGSYAAVRAASVRPVMSFAALCAGRYSRALQLSWVGLVRR